MNLQKSELLGLTLESKFKVLLIRVIPFHYHKLMGFCSFRSSFLFSFKSKRITGANLFFFLLFFGGFSLVSTS